MIKTLNELEARLEDVKVSMDVAIIGCIVNGLARPKKPILGLPVVRQNLLYVDGEPNTKLENTQLVDDLERIIRAKAQSKLDAEHNLIAKA